MFGRFDLCTFGFLFACLFVLFDVFWWVIWRLCCFVFAGTTVLFWLLNLRVWVGACCGFCGVHSVFCTAVWFD